MALTTDASSVDLARSLPEIAPYARTTVRLHPRRGEPGVRDSHIGGPLLWPGDEPWPYCDEHKDINGRPLGPYPLVAVAQLTAADFPEIAFPAETDLAQVLWCPDWHDQPHPEGWGQACRVFWRRAADIGEVLAEQPDPAEHWEYDSDMVPRPCVLRPERVVEYPWPEELPDGLRERLDDDTYDDVSTVPGCKLGGGMGWATTDMPFSLTCGDCGGPLALFVQFDTYEFTYGGREPDRFWPLEERHLEPGTPAFNAAREPTGMTVGRGSHAGLFLCTTDPTHPPTFFTQ